MKILLMMGFLLAGTTVFAEDIKTLDGTVYRNVTIVSADPERMLIVHDGGGCQVAYDNLGQGALTEAQRKAVAKGIKEHLERQARLEQLQLERAKFEQAQRDKGLIEFEGEWMKPEERREIMALRELEKLDRERERVALEKERAELEKARLATERERARLEESRSRSSSVSYYYPVTSRRYCDPVYSYRHRHDRDRYGMVHKYYRTPRTSVGVSYRGDDYSISFRSGSSGHANRRR